MGLQTHLAGMSIFHMYIFTARCIKRQSLWSIFLLLLLCLLILAICYLYCFRSIFSTCCCRDSIPSCIKECINLRLYNKQCSVLLYICQHGLPLTHCLKAKRTYTVSQSPSSGIGCPSIKVIEEAKGNVRKLQEGAFLFVSNLIIFVNVQKAASYSFSLCFHSQCG